jgi:drug/metabolite transporter (DMT)-like permease
MTILAILLILASVGGQVGGQIFYKLAMNCTRETGGNTRRNSLLAAGIATMAVSFFLWLALLSKFPLSKMYPFEGVERVFLVVAAAVFLKEKITLRVGFGVLLICAGIALVTSS